MLSKEIVFKNLNRFLNRDRAFFGAPVLDQGVDKVILCIHSGGFTKGTTKSVHGENEIRSIVLEDLCLEHVVFNQRLYSGV